MTTLTEQEVRAAFKKLNAKDSATHNTASTGRENDANPYNGNEFIRTFDDMLDENFKTAKKVFERFER